MDRLSLPARMESLPRFRDFVFQKLSAWKVAEALYPKIELILEEVLTNIFFYAYGQEAAGEAELACGLQGDMLILAASDRGAAFNPLESPPPNLTNDIETRSVGGLGIYFVREMVDGIAYERQAGKNILTMSIRVAGQA